MPATAGGATVFSSTSTYGLNIPAPSCPGHLAGFAPAHYLGISSQDTPFFQAQVHYPEDIILVLQSDLFI